METIQKNGVVVMFETKIVAEKAVLFGLFAEGEAEDNLLELEELAKTSGAEVIGFLTQNREKPHPATYFGKGKAEELAETVRALDADLIICDDELTPSQIKHLERITDARILDRTSLILDIFAMRANSAEGKAQVELAQHKYRLSRLTGKGIDLSRLGGAASGGGIIGSRGPGEKKLETDKRHIRGRISELNAEIRELSENRAVMRAKREKNNIPVISMVGYTNAGKSTLMNYLTDAGVLAEDKLFATLDTTTRRIKLPSGPALFTDTVGFISKLPHQLVSAFKATLEELQFADVLVHIVDTANARREEQMAVVYKTLTELGLGAKPVIALFNKVDLLEDSHILPKDYSARAAFTVSAKTGLGVEAFLNGVSEVLRNGLKEIEILLPYSEGKLIAGLHSLTVLSEEHTDEGVKAVICADAETAGRYAEYIRGIK
jgi:GTP-binding protein HflX